MPPDLDGTKRAVQTRRRGTGKAFPHNLRHLFATVFYPTCQDISKLANLFGHSSIEATRIYLIASGAEHQRQIERLNLVS
jgi:integrase/recombinase XerD